VRFLYSGISFNCVLLGLTATTLTAVAAPVSPAPSIQAQTHSLQIDRQPTARLALYESDRTVIKGNGVQFTMPAGFQGGSPSSSETRAMVAETAKMLPSMASFVKVLDSDPAMLRAIAMSTNPQQTPGMVLVTRLPIPANVSLESIQEMMAKLMPSMLPPEFKLTNNQIVNVGSRQIVQMGIDVRIRGFKLQESIGLFKEGDDIYQVTYVYATENSQQAVPVFKQAIDTFKATPTTTARTPIL
jgi:hypothetical protein